MNKGLARLIFIVVFLIPVIWYLFLQMFGSNSFQLEVQGAVDESCQVEEITILRNTDSLSVAKRNYYYRVEAGAKDRDIKIVTDSSFISSCINQNASELVLVSKDGVWGFYELSREGVDQLLTELDILILQENYGESVSR